MLERNPNGNGRRPENEKRRPPMSEREVYRNAPSRYRRRRGRGVNMAVVLLSVLLIAALAASVFHIIKLSGDALDSRRDRIEQAINSDREESSHEKTQVQFDSVMLSRADVHRGDLILVNYDNPYVFPDDESALVSISQYKTEDYRVAYPSYQLDSDLIAVFNDFAADLREVTGERCLLINSAYRNFEDQQSTYDNYVANYGPSEAEKYVADPGKSEHHTGLSMDLTIMFDDGTYQKMSDYENYDTINTLCVKYGFIHRYPATKESYTHILHEPWHYRYVGVPHSYVISKEKLCLEEYITYVKGFTLDGKLLSIDGEGTLGECDIYTMPTAGYVIYYVPAVDGDNDIKIPGGADEYTVSGNNSDGFVVAVRFGEVTLPEASFAIVG